MAIATAPPTPIVREVIAFLPPRGGPPATPVKGRYHKSVERSPALKSFLRRRLVAPLAQQLRQGITPGRLAGSLALGLAIGIIPFPGVATPACAALALGLRLNQPAIQVANYAAYPLQIALLIPFFKLGAWTFGAPPVAFSLERLRADLALGVWQTVERYGLVGLRAVGAWALLAVPVTLVLLVAFRSGLRYLPLPKAEVVPVRAD
jgi:uncharacterized protein (DUF2062 family)